MFEELKRKREELGKSIEEISEITKIKKSCIQYIEEGNFDKLPIEIYTKSYIKTYCETLGINPEPFIKNYEDYLKSKNIYSFESEIKNYEEKSKKQKVEMKNLPKWTVTLIIISVVFISVLLLTRTSEKHEEISPPSKIETTSVPQQKTEEQNLSEEQIIQKQSNETKSTESHNILKIEATDEVWMRIIIDGKEKKEFFLTPGQSIQLNAEKFFKLHIGNAGGVKINFNDKDLGKLGEKGQVVYFDLPEETL